ncbi:MAG: ABC transporter ATP-binding protein [Elusimicrobia bacterium]|nr:ABC transporter ATP-binding protein [Elusimicrobiota bacterium]
MARPQIAVQVRGLRHVYPALRRGGQERVALEGIDLEVARGEVFGLLGPNGGGKTTTFRILATALAPSAGSALVLGLDVQREAAALRRRIGVVFQSPGLDRRLTVHENLKHHGHLYGLRGSELGARIAEVLGRVGLAERAGDPVEGLSGGLRRRAELAKGLLHRPELLILDEPSTGLDPGARKDLWAYLRKLQGESGVTVLATTHLMDEAERCDRLAILDRGRVVASGTPDALKEEIGGDVISVRGPDPARLMGLIGERFGLTPELVDDVVRIERAGGHSFIPALVEAFPGQIASVTLGKPTLEDVFIHRTRHRFWVEGEGG